MWHPAHSGKHAFPPNRTPVTIVLLLSLHPVLSSLLPPCKCCDDASCLYRIIFWSPSCIWFCGPSTCYSLPSHFPVLATSSYLPCLKQTNLRLAPSFIFSHRLNRSVLSWPLSHTCLSTDNAPAHYLTLLMAPIWTPSHMLQCCKPYFQTNYLWTHIPSVLAVLLCWPWLVSWTTRSGLSDVGLATPFSDMSAYSSH